MEEDLARRFGFPVFPLDDGMSLGPTCSEPVLNWLLTYGTFYNYVGSISKGFDYYLIERHKDTHILHMWPPDDPLDFYERPEAEKASVQRHFSSLKALRLFLQEHHLDLTSPPLGWKWDCDEDEAHGWADEHGKKLPHPHYFGLPTFPLWDDMPLLRAYPFEEFLWLLHHGHVERRLPPSRSWKHPDVEDILQELTYHEGQFCLVEYAPEYRGDDHDQALVTIRKYATLPELLQQEHIDLEQLGVCGEKEEQWHWTYYQPAAIANGGHL
jgi:hypothetical protein